MAIWDWGKDTAPTGQYGWLVNPYDSDRESIEWRAFQYKYDNAYRDRVQSMGRGQDLEAFISQQVAASPTGKAQEAKIEEFNQSTRESEARAAAARAQVQAQQAAAAESKRKADAERVIAERIARETAAKRLYQSNMQTLGVNSTSENTPSIVGGATAQGESTPDGGASMGRPRRRRSALSSQLGITI